MKNLNVSMFTKWANNSFGNRKGNQKAALMVRPESELVTLDIAWGLTPVYINKVIRRRGDRIQILAAA